MPYFYTYKLPFNQEVPFDYWIAIDSESVIDMAFSKYKTHNFFLDEATKEMYFLAKGIPFNKTNAKIVKDTHCGTIKLLLTDRNGKTFEIGLGRIKEFDAEEKAQEIIDSINRNSEECVEFERT